jgi:hypothetical protein
MQSPGYNYSSDSLPSPVAFLLEAQREAEKEREKLEARPETGNVDGKFLEHMRLSSHGGYPIAGWFIPENPNDQWMI